MDQIDCYKNVGTKLIATSKCRDQNGVFAKKEKKNLHVTRVHESKTPL